MIDLVNDMPDTATPPRFMSRSHPDAVGSYGPELIEWAAERQLHPKRSAGTRWWQQQVANRALEHDSDGALVWPAVIVSGPRQTGKSWLERMVCAWRIHQAERFGEEQALLHVAHKLVAAQEVWRPAARWAVGAGGKVRWANGEQQIELPDGSRWMIQAATDGAGVAFALSMALIDEAWRVPRQVHDEAIEPTTAEASSPQIWLVSTAGTSESDLMSANRAAALAELDDPQRGSTLLVEWSAPPDPDLDIDDPAVWRGATPFYDARRDERMRTARGRLTERAFRQQWLNQWVPSVSTPALSEAMWSAALCEAVPGRPLALGVEVTPDRSGAVIVAAGGGVVEVIDDGPGTAWLPVRVRELVVTHDPAWVVFDGLGPAGSVAESLRDELGARLLLLTGRDVAAASGQLFDRLTATPPRVGLRWDDGLHRAVLAARQRRYGQTWVFARDVVAGVSGAPLAAAALALFGSERAPALLDAEESGIW